MNNYLKYLLTQNIVTQQGYLFSIIFITSLATFLCSQFIIFESGNILFPLLWLAGFFFLFFNVAYNLICSIAYLLTKPYLLKEKSLSIIPPCAIIYPVRNEDFGLYERISFTLQNNNLPGLKLFILSDSDYSFLEYENDLIKRLQETFGLDKIHYRHRDYPIERKQGNIKNWLQANYNNFKYFFVCDADSMAPKNTILKLLQKAEAEENNDIAIFQTRVIVAHAKTLFSMWQALSSQIAQRLYVEVNNRIFKRSHSFGHGNLIRMEPFLDVKIPKGVLSHDIWDMALLDQRKYRTVFCPDVLSFEEVPSHYLGMRARDKRWIKGNLQTLPLLVAKNLSLGARFYIFYGIYMYLCQPIFLFWIILSLFGASMIYGQFLFFQPLIIDEKGASLGMTIFSLIVLGIIFLHKFIICRSSKDIRAIFIEIFFSTLISLNNIFYHSVDIFFLLFQNIIWIPMKKDPFEVLSLFRTFKALWPGSLLGIYLFLFGIKNVPYGGAMWALPILISFMLSIPIVYLTSLQWPIKFQLKVK